MCGISGCFAFSREAQVDVELVAQMTATLSHRGPDGDGLRQGAGYALGHRRLAIVDVAETHLNFASDRSKWLAGAAYTAYLLQLLLCSKEV